MVNGMFSHCDDNTKLMLLYEDLKTRRGAIDAVVEASYTAPLAIIVVGVGAHDFTAMEVLNADKKPLKVSLSSLSTASCCSYRMVAFQDSKSRVMKKNILQFVPFRRFASGPPHLLAQATLTKLTVQLVDFMHDHNIQPNKSKYQVSAHTAPAAAVPSAPASYPAAGPTVMTPNGPVSLPPSAHNTAAPPQPQPILVMGPGGQPMMAVPIVVAPAY
jgi:hypothetical protein